MITNQKTISIITSLFVILTLISSTVLGATTPSGTPPGSPLPFKEAMEELNKDGQPPNPAADPTTSSESANTVSGVEVPQFTGRGLDPSKFITQGSNTPAPSAGGASSQRDPHAMTEDELIAELNKFGQAQNPTTDGTGTPSTSRGIQIDQDRFQQLRSERDVRLRKRLSEILEPLKGGTANLDQSYAAVAKLTDTYGLTAGESEKIMAQFRDAVGRQYNVGILRSGRSYEQLTDAEKNLFRDDETVYSKDLEELNRRKTALVEASLDATKPVFDAVSFETLTKEQQSYFGESEDQGAVRFKQAQSDIIRSQQLSDEETAFLTKREEYLFEDIELKKLKQERSKEKDPDQRKEYDAQIREQEQHVKSAFDAYVSLQPQALGAAYARQATHLEARIKSLESEIEGMEEGSAKSAKQREMASLMSQHQVFDMRAREAVGDLTFAERLNTFVSGYNQFSGLGQFSALFISDKDLAKRRQEADDLFCNKIPIGGTGCWTSKICESNIDASIGGTGIVAKTVTGEPRGAARLQADKSPPATFTNTSSRTTNTLTLYRFSYFLTNTNDKNLTYNLVIYGSDGRTIRAFGIDKQLSPGSSESRIRTSAIVKYSTHDYTKACLELDPGITRITGGVAHEICTDIASYSGGATTVSTTGQPAGGSGGTSGVSSGPGATRPDFEGF